MEKISNKYFTRDLDIKDKRFYAMVFFKDEHFPVFYGLNVKTKCTHITEFIKLWQSEITNDHIKTIWLYEEKTANDNIKYYERTELVALEQLSLF